MAVVARVLLAATATAVPIAHARPVATRVRGDFDGDGFTDLDNGDGGAQPDLAAARDVSGADAAVPVFRATSAGATAKSSFAFGARVLGAPRAVPNSV
ncbi:hypothetical protein GCM10011579_015440 [Streptomyces albiflavescens]|uniref:Esterase n=1 Tax=Streptomyces albiflavescens TaxID=1623582 RepID=A0A918D135_9ACTN|nr:hypothetical protein [Streptomyces albiflavescens]GGN55417.1 hypothetical protein GCM10011579_015440 [Streptomyces albiflavescens]